MSTKLIKWLLLKQIVVKTFGKCYCQNNDVSVLIGIDFCCDLLIYCCLNLTSLCSHFETIRNDGFKVCLHVTVMLHYVVNGDYHGLDVNFVLFMRFSYCLHAVW